MRSTIARPTRLVDPPRQQRPHAILHGVVSSSPMAEAALDWDDVRFFLAVARLGSFSSAARALGVTQPTVGRRIAGLDERAERVEAELLAFERVASGRDAGVAGPVRITASEWLVDRVLAPITRSLLEAHPGLEVDLAGEPRHVSLVRREADIAVRPSR